MILQDAATRLIMIKGETTVAELRRFVDHLDACEYEGNVVVKLQDKELRVVRQSTIYQTDDERALEAEYGSKELDKGTTGSDGGTRTVETPRIDSTAHRGGTVGHIVIEGSPQPR